MYSGIVNGQPTTFGTSGLLYRSNKVMYDRATRSLWRQFTGEPIIGPLATAGIRQPLFPSVVTTWQEWLAEHPDTTVLSRNTGVYEPDFYLPEHHPSAIYYSYFTDAEVMFPVWIRDSSFAPKSVVIGVSIGDANKAYPVEDLQQIGVVNDIVGGEEIVVVASSESRSARVYRRNRPVFSAEPNQDGDGSPTVLTDSAGVSWRVTEAALVNVGNPIEALPRVPTRTSFWFGWYQYHPDTEVYQPER